MDCVKEFGVQSEVQTQSVYTQFFQINFNLFIEFWSPLLINYNFTSIREEQSEEMNQKRNFCSKQISLEKWLYFWLNQIRDHSPLLELRLSWLLGSNGLNSCI